MQFGWSTLALIVVPTAVAWFWQNSLAARERANAAALDACERLSLQFLDGTVAFARIAFVRDTGGRIALQRTYVFDYTADSIARREGFVVLTGLRVDSVGYAPGDEARPTPPPARPQEPPIEHEPAASNPATSSPGKSNILKLDDWRAKRREQPERKIERRDQGG